LEPQHYASITHMRPLKSLMVLAFLYARE